jgi:hypothetical protein
MAVKLLQYIFNEYPKDFAWKQPPYEYEFKKLPIDILMGNGTFRKEFIESAI